MKMNLDSLSEKELIKLKADVDKAIANMAKTKKAEARKAAEAVAKKHGFALKELVGGSAAKMAKSAAAPKFKNPADASQTWSGRGRQPQWYKDAIKAGKKPGDLAV